MATAADIMTTELVTVAPETSVREVANILEQHRFSAVPVVDATGTVHGVVSEEDMVARAARIHLPRHIDFLGGIIFLENPQTFSEEAEKILAAAARDIMDKQFTSLRSDTPVEEIATRMLAEDLRRVFVLDDAGHLQGVVTRADIVRMLTMEGQLPENGS